MVAAICTVRTVIVFLLDIGCSMSGFAFAGPPYIRSDSSWVPIIVSGDYEHVHAVVCILSAYQPSGCDSM